MSRSTAERSELPDERCNRIRRIVDEFKRKGMGGGESTIHELIAQNQDLLPELADELAQVAGIRQVIDRARGSSDPHNASSFDLANKVTTSFSPGQSQLNSDEELELEESDQDRISHRLKIKGYEVLGEINRGGQAVVFKARKESTGGLFAVKMLLGGLWATTQQRARFDREVEVLARRLKHPNIVSVIERGTTDDGLPYFVMEYVDGTPLNKYIDKCRQSDGVRLDQMLHLFVKIAEAVGAAHIKGIVHRDLKPNNIMIDAHGEPHVLDFGLAGGPWHAVGDTDSPADLTISGQFLGTLPWFSPEQAEGRSTDIDARSDVYSLGVILYQMLTGGRFPYKVVGGAREVLDNILNTPPTPLSGKRPVDRVWLLRPLKLTRQSAPRVNRIIEAIVLKSLCKRREDRYQSAGEFARDVRSYLEGRPTIASSDVWYIPKNSTRLVSRIVALLAVLAAAVLLIGWVTQGRFRDSADQTAHIPEAAGDPLRTEGTSEGSASVNSGAKLSGVQLATARVKSLNNVKQIIVAMHLYADMFGGPGKRSSAAPKLDFEFLLKHSILENPSALVSPFDFPELPAGFYSWSPVEAQAWALANCSYIMLDFGDPKVRGIPHRYNVVSVYEKFAPHKLGIAVAFEDGSVKWMEKSEARQLIEKQTGKPIEE